MNFPLRKSASPLDSQTAKCAGNSTASRVSIQIVLLFWKRGEVKINGRRREGQKEGRKEGRKNGHERYEKGNSRRRKGLTIGKNLLAG